MNINAAGLHLLIWAMIVAFAAATPVCAQVTVGPASPTVVQRIPEDPPPIEPPTPPGRGPISELPQPTSPAERRVLPLVRPVVGSIEFAGNTVIPSSELAAASGMQVGQTLSTEIIDNAIESIQQAYQERGYIAAVAGVGIPGPGERGAVTFRIEELRITEIRFQGLRRVREQTLRRVTVIEPGQLFSRQAATGDFVRLQELGVFETLASDLEFLGPGEAALVWTIEERAQFNYIDVGGSYSPADRLVGTAELILGNVGGRAERLRLAGSISSVDGQVGGEVDYFLPWIGRDNTSAQVRAYSAPRYRFSSDLVGGAGRYYERRSGFRGSVTSLIRPFTTGTAGVRIEAVDVNNLPTGSITDTINQDSRLYLGNLRIAGGRRDSAIDPTTGTFTTGFLEGGISDPTDADGIDLIARTWADRRWYVALREPKRTPTGQVARPVPVLALRGMLGVSAGRLPFYEQFFVGGIGDLPLRGYVEDRFWGKYSFLANVELRWPLFGAVTGVAFVDVGDAWGTRYQLIGVDPAFEQHENFSPRAGAGVGIRYATPLGPLRIDLAYGDALRTHVSLGQTF